MNQSLFDISVILVVIIYNHAQ